MHRNMNRVMTRVRCLCVFVWSTEYIKHLDDSCTDRRIAQGLSTMSTLAYLRFQQQGAKPETLGNGSPQWGPRVIPHMGSEGQSPPEA